MMLNIREASFATGIDRELIRRHIRAGKLPRYGRYVDEQELFAYAVDRWREGRCLMHEPNEIVKRLEHLAERKQNERD